MPLAEILANFGGGRYQIRELRENATAFETLAKFFTEREQLNSDIADLDTKIQAAFTAQEDVLLALDNAIDAIEPGKTETFDAVREILNLRFVVSKGLGILRTQRSQKQIRLTTVKKEIELIEEQFVETKEGFAWCVDYTPDLPIGSAVGLLAINRTRLPEEYAVVTIPSPQQEYFIAPGNNSTIAPYNPDKHGFRSIVAGRDPSATFYNISMLPPSNVWRPTFALGTLTSVNKPANTCELSVDPVLYNVPTFTDPFVSFPANLEILTDVPIVYMACNAEVFEIGDKVVIEFLNRDPSTPRVIGFQSNPVECAPGQPGEGENINWQYLYDMDVSAGGYAVSPYPGFFAQAWGNKTPDNALYVTNYFGAAIYHLWKCPFDGDAMEYCGPAPLLNPWFSEPDYPELDLGFGQTRFDLLRGGIDGDGSLYVTISTFSGIPGNRTIWGLAKFDNVLKTLTVVDRFDFQNFREPRVFYAEIWNPEGNRLEGWYHPGDLGDGIINPEVYNNPANWKWATWNGNNSFSTLIQGAPILPGAPVGGVGAIFGSVYGAYWNPNTNTPWIMSRGESFPNSGFFKVNIYEIDVAGQQYINHLENESGIRGFVWDGTEEPVFNAFRGMSQDFDDNNSLFKRTAIWDQDDGVTKTITDEVIPQPDPVTDPPYTERATDLIATDGSGNFYAVGSAFGGGLARYEFWKYIKSRWFVADEATELEDTGSSKDTYNFFSQTQITENGGAYLRTIEENATEHLWEYDGSTLTPLGTFPQILDYATPQVLRDSVTISFPPIGVTSSGGNLYIKLITNIGGLFVRESLFSYIRATGTWQDIVADDNQNVLPPGSPISSVRSIWWDEKLGRLAGIQQEVSGDQLVIRYYFVYLSGNAWVRNGGFFDSYSRPNPQSFFPEGANWGIFSPQWNKKTDSVWFSRFLQYTTSPFQVKRGEIWAVDGTTLTLEGTFPNLVDQGNQAFRTLTTISTLGPYIGDENEGEFYVTTFDPAWTDYSSFIQTGLIPPEHVRVGKYSGGDSLDEVLPNAPQDDGLPDKTGLNVGFDFASKNSKTIYGRGLEFTEPSFAFPDIDYFIAGYNVPD